MAGFRRSRQRRRAPWWWRYRLALVAGGVALAALVIILAIVAHNRPRGGDQAVSALARQNPTQAEVPSPTEVPSPAPTVVPLAATASPAPLGASAAERALTRPAATAPGFLPVFGRANTEEKVVAITVDDCFQAENLRAMVDAALENGAKLTIFPIGENVLRTAQAEVLKYAWEHGFELENHTFTHNGLYACSDAELAAEVYKQQLALSSVLGVEYQCHFLRPLGGSASWDQRIHAYAGQLGYYGIAHWSGSSGSGTVSDRKLAEQLQPGVIFLFHTTDKDRDKLVRFIPWVIAQGYQLVTLNELFGYPENETAPLTKDIRAYEIPPLQPYERVYVPYKKPSYAYGVYLLQEKLIEMGYLSGEPDGIYGGQCVAAVQKYQKDHGLEQTGVADAELQRQIFEGN